MADATPLLASVGLGRSADYPIFVTNPATGDVVAKLAGLHTARVLCTAFSPSAQALASTGDDRRVSIVARTAGGAWEHARTLETVHRGDIYSIAWTVDGAHLLLGADDKSASLVVAATGEVAHHWEGLGGRVEAVAVSPDGEHAALASSGGKKAVSILSLRTRQEVAKLEGGLLGGATGYIETVAFSPNGRHLAVGSTKGAGIVEMVGGSASSWKQGPAMPGAKGWVCSAAWTTDGADLLLGLQDGPAMLVAASTGAVAHTWAELHKKRKISCVAVSADGEHVATGSWDKTVSVLSLRTYERTQHLKMHPANVMGVTF